ncbi:hypothetical protein [Paenarthrobacter sp. NPDC058040]|uniref:hypothetical protein n=1 Tax=unclassified Paenarthrobacter TaxID=2634190 RepID=UPI0036D886DA
MKNRRALTDEALLSVLAQDDRVEVCDEQGNCWAGQVDIVAPDLGVLWILTDSGERKAVDVYDYSIRTR